MAAGSVRHVPAGKSEKLSPSSNSPRSCGKSKKLPLSNTSRQHHTAAAVYSLSPEKKRPHGFSTSRGGARPQERAPRRRNENGYKAVGGEKKNDLTPSFDQLKCALLPLPAPEAVENTVLSLCKKSSKSVLGGKKKEGKTGIGPCNV